MIGTVKWFDNQKGYGFLTDSENNDYFVHFSSIESDGYKSLEEGEEVDFDIIENEKGKQAAGVRKR